MANLQRNSIWKRGRGKFKSRSFFSVNDFHSSMNGMRPRKKKPRQAFTLLETFKVGHKVCKNLQYVNETKKAVGDEKSFFDKQSLDSLVTSAKLYFLFSFLRHTSQQSRFLQLLDFILWHPKIRISSVSLLLKSQCLYSICFKEEQTESQYGFNWKSKWRDKTLWWNPN